MATTRPTMSSPATAGHKARAALLPCVRLPSLLLTGSLRLIGP